MNRSKHNRVIVAQRADWGKEARARRKYDRVGLFHYKVERALALYAEGVGSLGYIAEPLDLPKQELIAEARRRGVEPD